MTTCLECGNTLPPAARRGPPRKFCATPCRMAFNRRRAVRGAELYDLVMAWRFQRADADKADARGLMGRLASAYRDSDKIRRAGRRSWDLAEAIERIPNVYGREGDKR